MGLVDRLVKQKVDRMDTMGEWTRCRNGKMNGGMNG